MSWLFSRALAVEFLGVTSLDGEPSAPSSGNPTQLAFLSHGKTTAFSRLSRFGMTCKPLTENRGEELLTSYRAAFPARTFPSQEKAQDSMESEAACGSTWRGWLAKYDPDTSSWKTAQCSFIEDSTESLETWPRSGMTRNGLLWELPTLERRTSATGSGLWPTPTVCGNYNRKGASKTSGDGLATAVMKRMWPTPNAGSSRWGGSMQEWGGSKNWVRKELPEMATGPLNPMWVEWLMGFPLGWTDLKPLETARFPCVLPQHSNCLPLEEAALTPSTPCANN